MKGTKQWKTASKRRWFCHKVGQLLLNVSKFGEVSVPSTIQKWIAIIETTRHRSSCKQYCSMNIKVTVNMPHIPNMVKAWVADFWYMWAEGKIFIRYYSKSLSRFCWVSLDTEKLNRKHRGTCSTVIRSRLGGIQFYVGSVSVYSSTSMTGRRPSMTVNHSVPQ